MLVQKQAALTVSLRPPTLVSMTLSTRDGRNRGRLTQDEKSAAMRERLLSATIECVIELGYARASTIEIAERAGVSRGAMLHHYPSRADLVVAAIEHLTTRRIAEFVATSHRFVDDATLVDNIVDLLWSHFASTSFDAVLELTMAARTDPELAAVIHPLERRIDSVIAHWGRELYERLSSSPESFERERRFIYYLMHGLAIRQRAGADPNEIRATLDDLKGTMHRARARIAKSGAANRRTNHGGQAV